MEPERKYVISSERKIAIKKHFDKTIRIFKKKALEMAIENNHPYIESLLNTVLIELHQNIKWSKADVQKSEVHFVVEDLNCF